MRSFRGPWRAVLHARWKVRAPHDSTLRPALQWAHLRCRILRRIYSWLVRVGSWGLSYVRVRTYLSNLVGTGLSRWSQQRGVLASLVHRHILTCGEDTFVKIFAADDLDSEPRTLEHHDSPVTAIAIDRKVRPTARCPQHTEQP